MSLLHRIAENPALSRAGWVLLHSLWQGALMAALAAGALALLRTRSAAVRHTVSLTFLVLFALCLPLTWRALERSRPAGLATAFPASRQAEITGPASGAFLVEPASGPVSAGNAAQSSTTPPVRNPDVPTVSAKPRSWRLAADALTPWLAAAWLTGAGLLTLRNAGAWWWTRRWRRAATVPVPAWITGLLHALRSTMGMVRLPQIRIGPGLRGPALLGLLRPVILLPASVLTGLSETQLRAILAHELAHLQRHDAWWNALQCLLETVLFYHPATWWLGRRIRQEREHACDDRALAACGEPVTYARALTRLAELQLTPAGTPALAAQGGELTRRIRRVLGLAVPDTSPAPWAWAGLTFPVLLAAAAILLPRTPVVAQAEPRPADAPLYQYRWFVPAPRGQIVDRNGVPLAANHASWTLEVELRALPDAWTVATGEAPPMRERTLPRAAGPVTLTEPDYPLILADLFQRSGDPLLAKAGDAAAIGKRLDVWWRGSWTETVPFPVLENLSDDDADALRPVIAGSPALRLRGCVVRVNPQQCLAAHVLGFVRKQRPEEVSGTTAGVVSLLPGLTGAGGVEKAADAELSGIPAVVQGHFDRLQGIVETSPQPMPGKTVRLTLDARLQQIASETMREAGVGRGAAVVIDVSDGSILAIASVPDFDLTVFQEGISRNDWDALSHDPCSPMLDRSRSFAAPGSTFKLVTSLAALQAGKARSYNCPGQIFYGTYSAKCWTMQKGGYGHGTLSLDEALMSSCNCWFYQAGNACGMDELEAMATLCGIGQENEISGLPGLTMPMPGREWWEKQNKGPWTEAKTAQCSIGQGEVLATPVQITMITGGIANGGRMYRPRLIQDILPPGVDPATEPSAGAPDLRSDLLQNGITDEDLRLIRKGLWRVVNDVTGTAKRAKSDIVDIAGKSGTSQMKRFDPAERKIVPDNHTWFTGYSPVETPRYAITVVVANGTSGGGVSAPIARRILERWHRVETGEEPITVKPLAPAAGHFGHLETVQFSGGQH